MVFVSDEAEAEADIIIFHTMNDEEFLYYPDAFSVSDVRVGQSYKTLGIDETGNLISKSGVITSKKRKFLSQSCKQSALLSQIA